MIRVTVFNEYVHERNEDRVRAVYPDGIHGAIAQALGGIDDITVKCVTLDMPENGLTQQLLDETDVLIWWAHMAHDQVSDEVAQRVDDITVKCVTLDMPENGLTQQLLDETDVLIWWAHMAHDQVSDEVAQRVQRRVLDGMGFVALHSAHASKPFSLLLGTRSPVLRWRENDEQQRVWCVSPGHPIAAGLGESFVIPKDETYGEYFEIPTPDELVR